MFNFTIKLIISIFSNKKFNFISDIFLHLILKIKGYKNFGSFKETGEEYFLNDFLKKKKIKVCLDIGAHNGDYSKKLLNKGFKVIAFEPMSEAFINLKKIKKKYPNIFNCSNIALSNKNEVKEIFYINKNSQLCSLNENVKKINFLKNKLFKKFKIKTSTLDSFVKKNKKLFIDGVDFIKIDTEGNDFNVILGAKNSINRFKPNFIQIEMNYHNLFNGENLYQFHKLLKDYKIYKILPFNNGLIRVDPSRPENNIYHLSNFIFMKK
jgi:FkbM family methyltransferase